MFPLTCLWFETINRGVILGIFLFYYMYSLLYITHEFECKIKMHCRSDTDKSVSKYQF